MDIWIKDVDIIPMTGSQDIYIKSNIYIKNNRIAHIGEYNPAWLAEEIIDGAGMVALPGLINAHTHLGMSLFRNYADDLNLEDWLHKEIWPIEAQLSPEDIYVGSKLSMIEMIQSGTTSFSDMYFSMDEVAKAVVECGLRGVLSRGLTEDADNRAKIEDVRRMYKQWNGFNNDMLKVMVAPHSLYTCSPDFITELVGLAKELGSRIHIHLSETKTEVVESISKHLVSPVILADNLDLLSPNTIAAHCVYVDDRDLNILKDNQVHVVHNPSSNLKLASGFAPVKDMLDMGINVCLGTDGASSNNNLNMFEEMHIASLIAKAYNSDPTALNAYEVLEMATVNGAKALGFKDLGRLEKDAIADIILVNFNKVHHTPRNNLISNLVYSTQASDVDTVIIDGKIVMRERKIPGVDIEKLKAEAEQTLEQLTKRLACSVE